eukprot:1016878-Rhodomonas_salina.2
MRKCGPERAPAVPVAADPSAGTRRRSQGALAPYAADTLPPYAADTQSLSTSTPRILNLL